MPPNASPTRMQRLVAAFRNYNFRLFWFGQMVSQGGAWMQKIGQAWLVLELTHSGVDLGIVAALQAFPILCGSLFASVVVDRMPKHRLLLVTQSTALLQAAILAVLTVSGEIRLWHLYVLAVVLGIVNAFDNPTRLSFVTELVGRDQVVNAVALNSAMMNGARLFGPALGGLVIAAWGVGACFTLNAVSFLAVLLGLLLMRRSEFRYVPPRRSERSPLIQELGDGLRFVLSRSRLVTVLIVLAGIGMFGYNFNTVVPLLAEQGLGLGPDGFGLLMTAVGLGALLGALGVASSGKASTTRILVTGFGFGAIELGLSIAPSFVAAFVLLTALSMCGIVFATSCNSTLQLEAPENLRGRVMGMYTLLMAGTTPIGALLTGFLSSTIGIRPTIAAWAAVCAASALAAWIYRSRQPGSERRPPMPVAFGGRPPLGSPAPDESSGSAA